MKTARLLFCVLGVMLLSKCDPISETKEQEKTVQEFRGLSDSLEASNDRVLDPYIFYYKQIQKKKGKNTALALKANNLYNVMQKAKVYLDSLKNILEDENGHKTLSPKQLFANESVEQAINSLTEKIYQGAVEGLANKNKKAQVDSIMLDRMKYLRQKGWAKIELDGVPASVAITTLNAIEMHYKNAAEVTLKDIFQAMDQ